MMKKRELQKKRNEQRRKATTTNQGIRRLQTKRNTRERKVVEVKGKEEEELRARKLKTKGSRANEEKKKERVG